MRDTEKTSASDALEQMLLAQQMVTPEQLQDAIDSRKKILETGVDLPLEDVLVRKGLLTPQQLAILQAATGQGSSDLIKGYEIQSKLGQGGMGAIYKARQIAMDREVAIKVLLPNNARDQESRDRFLHEARTIAMLSHESIVQGIDAGTENGIYYVIMEFVQGKPLDRVLKKRGTIPFPEALEIIRKIASALKHASDQGVIHRDIKPANIILNEQGIPKVADFGLAQMVSGNGKARGGRDGTVLGTPSYMSPEQIRGEKSLDLRTDIYSLGLIFYQMLTGKKAYEGPVVEELMQFKLKNDIPLEPLQATGVSAPTITVIQKMCARDRKERYASVEELLDDLNRLDLQDVEPVEEGKPASSRNSSSRLRVSGAWRSSQQPVPPLVVVAGVLVVLVIGAIFLFKGRDTQPVASHTSPTDSGWDDGTGTAVKDPVVPALPDPPPAPVSDPVVPAEKAPVENEAGKLWTAALAYESTYHETKPEDVLLNYLNVKKKLRGTTKILECELKIEEWKNSLTRQMQEEEKKLQAEVTGWMDQKKFMSARRAIEKRQLLFQNPSLQGAGIFPAYQNWTVILDRLQEKVQKTLAVAIQEIRIRAKKAQDGGKLDDARKIWIEMNSFEDPERSEESKAQIAAIDLLEETLRKKEEDAVAKVREAWELAIRMARKRKYASAVAAFSSLPPEVRSQAQHLERLITLARSVFEDALKRNSITRDTPADRIFSAYRLAQKSVDPEDQALARCLFALFEGELKRADSEARSLRKDNRLPKEVDELMVRIQKEEEVLEEQRKEAGKVFRAWKRYHKATSRRKEAVAEAERIQKEIGELLPERDLDYLEKFLATYVGGKEILVYADDVKSLNGNWKLHALNNKSSRKQVLWAEGVAQNTRDRFRRNNPHWVELEVNVLAGKEYALWMHMSAFDSGENSVYLQFEGAVMGKDLPYFPIGGREAITLSYWRDGQSTELGWTGRDEVRQQSSPIKVKFDKSGRKKIRIYARETKTMWDQFVLSSEKYIDDMPGQHLLKK